MSKPLHAKCATAVALCVISSAFVTSSYARPIRTRNDITAGQYSDWATGGNTIFSNIGKTASCFVGCCTYTEWCGESPKPASMPEPSTREELAIRVEFTQVTIGVPTF